MMGVSGMAGDPANPPRPARAMPPLPLGEGPGRLAAAFDRLGWHWWPSDSAVCSTEYRGRGACNLCGPCSVGCVRHARASADIAYAGPAEAAGARILTGARALRITAGAKGVDYSRGGARHHLAAGTVIVAANGMGSARLLLISGLANSSGLVGRHLMHHPTALVTGQFAERMDGHKGPFACALYCQEFIETDPARGFLRGYQMQIARGGGPVQTALGGYMARIPWGKSHHAELVRQFLHVTSLTVTSEDLPNPDNRVTLDPSRTDSDGLPAAALTYRVGDNTRRMLDHGIARASEALREAGAESLSVNPLAAAAGFHFLGTTRMGTNPATSVVDADCRSHDLPDLMVIDGGVFVTAGGVNPTSTIQAIALRAADALAARLGASA
jgi:choline dehydrogenase-like flavoprotein